MRSFFIANATDTNVRKIILPGNTTNSQMHHDLTRSECFLAFCTKYCPVIHKSAKVCWANGFLTEKRLLFTVFTSAVCFNLLDHHTNWKSINIHHQFSRSEVAFDTCRFLYLHILEKGDVNAVLFVIESHQKFVNLVESSN